MKTTITIEISPAEKISEPRAFGMPPVEYYEVKATATYKEPVEVSVEYPGQRPVKVEQKDSRQFEVTGRIPKKAFEDQGAPTLTRWRTFTGAEMAAKLTLAILKGLELEADQNAPQHG